LPISEDITPHPEDPYGIAKLAVEQELRICKEMFDLDYIIFRPHNVYGERQNIGDKYRNVVGIFMNQILQKKPMTIFGDGNQTRAFSYIRDVAPVIAESIEVPDAYNQVFNIGADQPYSVNQLAQSVAQAMDVEPNIVHLPPRNEVMISIHLMKKYKVFGERKLHSLEDGLYQMAEWLSNMEHESQDLIIEVMAFESLILRNLDRHLMISPLVISVVLNTNHREDTIQCLTSLSQNTYKNQQVILLDNASTDGTADTIRSMFPDVWIIALKRNLGYAGNNNVGIQLGLEQGADWVFVLNEDTILSPNCIAHLVSVGESDPTIGIVGPMVYHHNEPDVIQSAGGRMDKYYRGWHLGQDEQDEGQFQLPHPVEWISGCGIMVRRTVIEQVGAIDERFFIM
jgi:hypothetical protein